MFGMALGIPTPRLACEARDSSAPRPPSYDARRAKLIVRACERSTRAWSRVTPAQNVYSTIPARRSSRRRTRPGGGTEPIGNLKSGFNMAGDL